MSMICRLGNLGRNLNGHALAPDPHSRTRSGDGFAPPYWTEG